MTTAKTPDGGDVFDAVSQRLIALGMPLTALIPHAEMLPCRAEFAEVVEAWAALVKAWDAYLSADLRATLTQPESVAH